MSDNIFLSGKILIANGNFSDIYFNRTAVLICHHDKEGAYGLVLNRYTDLMLKDVFDDLAEINTSMMKLFMGGPVEANVLQVIHTLGDLIPGSKSIGENIYLGGDFEKIVEMFKTDRFNFDKLKFFLGYSGWDADQLEAELDMDSWIVAPAEDDFVYSSDVDSLWSEILDSLGGFYSILSHMPTDPSMN